MTAYWALDLPASDAPAERKRSEQLRGAARWITLLADELDALESGDFPRLRDLAEQRAKLAGELGVDPEEPGDPLPRPLHLEPVAEALRELRDWAEQERAKQEGLSQLRDESLPLVRSIQATRMGGRYQVIDETDCQLNVRM